MKSTEYIYHHPEIYVASRFPSAGKTFYPGGTDLTVRSFQDILKALSGKTKVALDLITRYGLAERVKLGKDPILSVKARADYLYQQSIHPRFFVEVLHLIGRNAKALDPQVSQINLRRLGRDNLQTALTAGAITHRDIGRHFELFSLSDRTDRDRLEILAKLGVIKFAEGRSLNDVFPRAAAPAPQPGQTDLRGQVLLPWAIADAKK